MPTKLATVLGGLLVLALAVAAATAASSGRNGRIAFAEQGAAGSQIWTVLPDGSDPDRLTTDGDSGTPAFSPDGRLIAFSSGRSARSVHEIWTMNADGSGQRQATHLGARAAYPDFSPSGAKIVFAGRTRELSRRSVSRRAQRHRP
jgi:Tol biopolymer transport system component